MPEENDARKGKLEKPEETENKKDDAKSEEEEIEEIGQEEAKKNLSKEKRIEL